MRVWTRVALLCSGVGACTNVTTPPVPISLTYDAANPCHAAIDGQTFAVWPDYKQAMPALRSAAVKSRNAIIVAGITVPYKCFGLMIFAAQEAGFKHVGFIAQSPAASSK